jgi:hypothetical protein
VLGDIDDVAGVAAIEQLVEDDPVTGPIGVMV